MACPVHGIRLRYFCPGCFARCEFQFEYRNGLADLTCSGCLTAVSRAPPEASEFRHADLLIATMEAIDEAAKGRAEVRFAEIQRAIRFLWSAPTNSGKPEIALFGAGIPSAGLSYRWTGICP